MATLVVAFQTDPAGDYPSMPAGPGLTVDEIFNVHQGALLADRLLAFDVPGLVQVGKQLPDHPPLARLWLGLVHEILVFVRPPEGQNDRFVVACARVASAMAFGLLIWIIGTWTTRRYGTVAGYGAAVSLALMPRVFAHAHLAALETTLNLIYTGVILSIVSYWGTEERPRMRGVLYSGFLLGLAFLTKIQAIFLPIPITIWVIWKWGHRAFVPLLLWGGAALLVFFVGWPWLWDAPLENVSRFLGHAKERTSINVWYAGRIYADRDVPWHYPWVLFLVTVPVGLHFLGGVGLCRSMHAASKQVASDSRTGWIRLRMVRLLVTQPTGLLLGSMLLPLLVFSVPGIAVYDGERLFLVVYPLWAIFVGIGMQTSCDLLRWYYPKVWATGLLTAFLAAQSVGVVSMNMLSLSYYNAFVGGLEGAEKRGFATTYWGDSINRSLLQKTAELLPADTTVECLPVLHTFQLAALETQCPFLRSRNITLQPFNSPKIHGQTGQKRYILAFDRKDYLPANWPRELPQARVLAVTEYHGVKLAVLLETTY